MWLTSFPEDIPALTDLIFISEKRLSHFLLVLAQSNNIIQHSLTFCNLNSIHLTQILTVILPKLQPNLWTFTLVTYCSLWYTFLKQNGINYFVNVAWYITLSCKFVFNPAQVLVLLFLHKPLNVQFLQVNSFH